MIIFPSLHLNSEYSLLESTIKIDSLISFALKNGINTLAITDHNVMSGVGEFVNKCKKNNIKSIIGLDLDVEDFRLILLAKNYIGFQELLRLSSKKAKGNKISVKDIETTNLYIIDHPRLGYFVKKGHQLKLKNYFVGIDEGFLPNGVFIQETKILNEKENKALKILESIKHNGQMPEKDFQFKSYKYQGESNNALIEQAIAIAKDCNVIFPKVKNEIPKFACPNNINSSLYFKELIQNGIQKYLINIKNKEKYLKRIKYELHIIEKLGFIDYFLIIWDVVNWAKKNKIVVGPGRGSTAGSLIAYLLNITEVDPIKFGLLFERFLNPERINMPDIDIDIEDIKREEVIDYLFKKYGDEKVGLISTFQRLGAKMSLRDCARAMKIPIRDVDYLCGLIKLNISLKESYKTSSRFRAAIDKTDQYIKLFNNAQLIEGLPRQGGTHAAGIVIANQKLNLLVPTTNGINDKNQVQYSMNYLEENGLLKIDLLALKNLNIIRKIQEEIYINFKKQVNLKDIPLNDKATNKLLSNADTNGIFQFESYGMKSTLLKIQVDSLEDIAAILSLYRPGPMDFIATYAKRKKGQEKIQSISLEYDKIVKPTQGIIIYQEQIMNIAQFFSGMSFAQADILRRAISKKKSNEITLLKKQFILGARSKGYKDKIIYEVFSNIEKFANYGFNKSHAVAYGILSYRFAFLKARFPLEFYTALIESSIGSHISIKKYIYEAKIKKINIVAPEINKSKKKVYNYQKNIILPLIIIKGFGEVANSKVINERAKGKFKNFFDFVIRVKNVGIGPSTILLLIQSGSLKAFGNVQTLTDALPSAIRFSFMITVMKEGQKIVDKSIIAQPKIIHRESDLKLEIAYEKKIFGFKLNSFETSEYEKANKLIDINKNQTKNVVILIEKIKKIYDKNEKEMGKAIVSDSTHTIELNIWHEDYKFISKTKIGTIVEATIYRKEFNGGDSYSITKPWKELNE